MSTNKETTPATQEVSTSPELVRDGVTEDGLIASSEAKPLGGLAKGVRAFVLLSGLFIMMGTAVVDQLYPLKRPRLLGGEKQIDDRMRQEAHFSDGSLAKLFEYDYRITSRVRSFLGKPYAQALFRYLDEGNDQVFVGKDGWMFLGRRLKVPSVSPEHGASRASALHAAITRRLQAHGVEYFLIPVPRKAVLYEKHLPQGMLGHRSYDEAILADFRKRQVPFLDLLTGFGEHEDLPVLFRKTDTHWSTYGMGLAARTAVDSLNLLAPEKERLGTVVDLGENFHLDKGDLLEMLDVSLSAGDKRLFDRGGFKASCRTTIQNPRIPDSVYALCGTSYSDHGELASFLSHYTGQRFSSYSTVGGKLFRSFTDLLTDRTEGSYPKLIVAEVPMHQLVAMGSQGKGWRISPLTIGIFSLLSSFPSIEIPLPDAAVKRVFDQDDLIEVSKTTLIAQLQRGRLGRLGAGDVDLQIDAELVAGEAVVAVHSGTTRFEFPWTSGRRSVALPALSQTATTEPISVYLKTKSTAQFRLHRLSLTTAAREETKVAASLKEPQREGARWTQSFDLPDGMLVNRNMTFVFELTQPKGSYKEVSVLFEDIGGIQHELCEFEILRSGGTLVVSPNALLGKQLKTVHFQTIVPGAPSKFTGNILENASWYEL